MNAYEKAQWARIRAWQLEPPPPVTRWLGKAAGPGRQAVQDMLPAEVVSAALSGVQFAAARLAGRSSILRRAGVDDLQALRRGDLAVCDELARQIRQRAVLVGSGGGALFGMAGSVGLVADVPSLLLLSFRTVYRLAYCYGEDLDADNNQALAAAIFALASANSVADKQLGLAALREPLHCDPSDAAWRDGLQRAAERELAKDAAMISLRKMSSQLGRRLGWRKAAGALPFAGAVIGGSVNGWYLHDLSQVASICFQARWLLRRHPSLGELGAESGGRALTHVPPSAAGPQATSESAHGDGR